MDKVPADIHFLEEYNIDYFFEWYEFKAAGEALYEYLRME